MYIYTWSIYPSFLSIYKFAVKITSWCDVNMAHKSKYKNRQQQQHHHHIEQMERIYNIQHTRKKIIIKRYKKFFFYWEKSNAHNVKKKEKKILYMSVVSLYELNTWYTLFVCVWFVCVCVLEIRGSIWRVLNWNFLNPK